MRWSWVIVLVGCRPPPVGEGFEAEPYIVVASTDFSVGALGAVDLADGEAHELLQTLGRDPVLSVQGDLLYVLERGGGDAITVYDVRHPDEPPLRQLALGGATNPHGLVSVGERLFVSLYEEAELAVFDAAGGWRVGSIDLSDWADADGIPEASELVMVGERLYLSLQRLDRGAGWVSSGGRVLAIDPVNLEVVEAYETPPNPRLGAPTADGALTVAVGHWDSADGALGRLDPEVGTFEELVREDEVGGGDVSAWGVGPSWLVAVTDPSGTAWWCLDPETGLLSEAADHTASWGAAVEVVGEADAWVALRAPWDDPTVGGGLQRWDLSEGCRPEGEVVGLSLEPYSLGSWP